MSAVDPANNSRCSRCGAAFRCGAVAADPAAGEPAQPCWCMAFAPVAAPVPGATCLCPACLAALTRAGDPAQST